MKMFQKFVCLVVQVVLLRTLYVSCTAWSVTLPENIPALLGSCVVIPCSFTCPDNHRPAEVVWYQYVSRGYPEVYHQNQANVIKEFKGYTQLVGNVRNQNCSLKIYPVTQNHNSQKIYAWIDPKIVGSRTYEFYGKTVTLQVTDVVTQPALSASGSHRAGSQVQLQCSAAHTCPSSPPTLSFSRHQAVPEVAHTEEQGGRWRVTAAISWTAQPEDDGKIEVCTVTHPGNRYASRELVLSISYVPVNVSVALSSGTPREGESITLSCLGVGNPQPHTYHWYKVEEGRTIQETQKSRDLKIKNINRHPQTFRCAPVNTIGEGQSGDMLINAEYPPKILNISRCSQSSGWLRCECVVEANPKADVQMASLLPRRSLTLSRSSEFGRNTVKFVFTGPDSTMQQNFTCKAQNPYGTDSQPLLLPGELTQYSEGVWMLDRVTLIAILVAVLGSLTIFFLGALIYWRIRKKRATPTTLNDVYENHDPRHRESNKYMMESPAADEKVNEENDWNCIYANC